MLTRKRSITVVICALLITSLAACGGGAQTANTEPVQNQTQAATQAATEATTEAATQNTSANTTEAVAADPSDKPGNDETPSTYLAAEKYSFNAVARKRGINGDFEEMILLKNLEEKTNIHINWEAVPESNYDEKKNLILASGDLPDFFFGPYALSNGDLITYGSQGVFIALEDLIEQYASNVVKVYTENPDFKSLLYAPDGHIYSTGKVISDKSRFCPGNMFMYKPWLDELGLPVPDTIDDLYNTLKAFKALGSNIIPMTCLFFDGTYGLCNLFGSFGRIDTGDHIVVENDRVVFSAIEPEFKTSIEYFRQFFIEGLIDEESFTQDQKQWKSKGATEEVTLGCTISWNDFDVFADRAGDYITVPPLEGPDGYRICLKVSSPGVNQTGFTITSVCSDPILALKWVDEFYDPITTFEGFYGPIGVNLYQKDDGSLDYLPTPEGLTYDEFRFMHTPCDVPATIFDYQWGDILPLAANAQKKVAEVEALYLPYATQGNLPPLLYSLEDTERIQILAPDINNFVKEKEATWLLEGGIEDEWEAYVERLHQMNVDELIGIYQRNYDQYLSNN